MNTYDPIVYYSELAGITFSRIRRVSSNHYHRMMRKLRWDSVLNRDDLFQALVEKDTQRLKRDVNKYVDDESKKCHDPGIFIKIPITFQELLEVDYLICYKIYTELSVKNIEKDV